MINSLKLDSPSFKNGENTSRILQNSIENIWKHCETIVWQYFQNSIEYNRKIARQSKQFFESLLTEFSDPDNILKFID